ncbi:MAG: FAD:protein FMN transferase [Sedimentisphaerales bacterium]|nr:FAD:protein FMN transferase [Sedimentisphaerales bacterium]
MNKDREQTNSIDKTTAVIPGMKRFSYEAMATTFEIYIVHEDEKYAGQAANAAFFELDRLEAELSRFAESSDITRINHLPAKKVFRLGLDAFECLKISYLMYEQTYKTFDITIGPLYNCWHNKDGSLRTPSQEEIDKAMQHVGMHLFELDERLHAIWLSVSPLQIDLGGVGKGYAVDKMAELLREWGINTALISGGFSSVLALDAPPGTKGWPLSLSNPNNRKQVLARPFLCNRALGSSGIKKSGHIIDPRKGYPVEGKIASWSSAPSAAVADVLSTAFMIMDLDEIEKYCSSHPDQAAMIIPDDKYENTQEEIKSFGPWQEVSLIE